MEKEENTIPIEKTIEKKKSHKLELCESLLKDYFFVKGDYTFRHRYALKEAGFKWNPDCKLWIWEDLSNVDIARKMINDLLSNMKKKKKESTKKSQKTKTEKGVYEKNKELIDTKISQLKEFNKKRGFPDWINNIDGYCIHCKRNWALKLNVEKYKEGIHGCPCCGRSWDD